MEKLASTRFTPAGVVADASAQLAGLDEPVWAARTPEASLVGAIEEPEASRCHWPRSRPTPCWPRPRRPEGPQDPAGRGSTSDWFTHLAGTHRSTGHRTVRQAPQLVTEPPRTHAGAAGAGRGVTRAGCR